MTRTLGRDARRTVIRAMSAFFVSTKRIVDPRMTVWAVALVLICGVHKTYELSHGPLQLSATWSRLTASEPMTTSGSLNELALVLPTGWQAASLSSIGNERTGEVTEVSAKLIMSDGELVTLECCVFAYGYGDKGLRVALRTTDTLAMAGDRLIDTVLVRSSRPLTVERITWVSYTPP